MLAGAFGVRYTLTKRAAFRVASAPQRPDRLTRATTARTTGHFVVEVTVAGQPKRDGPQRGMVIEVAEIRRVLEPLVEQLDATDPGDILPDAWQPPTLEHIAGWLLNALRGGGVPANKVSVHDPDSNTATAHSALAS